MITWTHKAYGREGDLSRMNRQRNDPNLDRYHRRIADETYTVIANQLRDKRLCSLREQLIRATIAGDQLETAKIELRIRDHKGEDKFAASGHKDY